MDVLTVESLGWICRGASVLCNEKIHFMVRGESEIMTHEIGQPDLVQV